jgi:phytoene desaturase
MTIYISIASRSDAALAPEGCESWYILMNAPASGIDHRDADARNQFAASVWRRLEHFGIRPEVLWESRLTPLDIETRYNSADGAIYGASSNSIFSAFLRPRNKAPGLRNLYFAGGSTHPGGGVPLVLLSGRITAGIVAEES